MTDLTSAIIDAVGGDPTSRTATANLLTSLAQAITQIQTMQVAFRSLSFTAASYSAPEGNSGPTSLTATMKRTGDLTQPLAVTTKFIPGTLNAADFVGGVLPGDLVFAFAAGTDTASASDQIKGDVDVEPTETLTRVIVPPPGYSFGAIASYTGNVLNDDSPSTALPSATFTATQLPTADRIYQRDSETGGGPNKGFGTISQTVNVSSAGAIYARCRDAEDGTTIVQAKFLAAMNVPVGNAAVTLSGIEARLGWFFVDLQNGDGTWTLGTTRVGMGGLMAVVSAQSLAVRMIRPVGGQTIAQQGLTPPKFGRVYATWSGENDDMLVPVWTMPADGALYAGAGMVQILNRLIALHGVNFGFVGHAWGGARSEVFGVLGQGNTYVRNILSAVGGFEYMLTFIGHTDSIDDTPQWKLRTNLSGAFDTGVGLNARGRRFRLVSMTIPTGTAPSGWGTATAQNHIRRITYDWATKEAGAECQGGVYAQMTGLTTSDGVHPDNQGGAMLADCIVNALINGSNTEDGTLPGLPTVAVQASYPGSKTYDTGKVFGQALVNGGVQFEPCVTYTAGVLSAAAWVYLTSYQDGARVFGDNLANYTLTSTGAIRQNNNAPSADGALPLNRWFQLVYTKIARDPLDPDTQNAFQIWVDGLKVLQDPYDGLTNSPEQFVNPATAFGMAFGGGEAAWTQGMKFGPYLLANKHLRGIIPANVTGQEPRIIAFADLNGSVVGIR